MTLHRVTLAIALSLLCTSVLEVPATDAGTDALRKQAVREGWPDTPAGTVAFGWVDAFSAGEKAMKSFLEANLSAADLAKRPASERLANYRKLRDRFGSLALAKVVKSAPSELTATLLAEDASRHTFTFTVEKGAPHRLVSVAYHEIRHDHGGGHH